MRFSLPKGRAAQLKKAGKYAHKHWRLVLLWSITGFFILSSLAILWAATLKLPDLASLNERKIEQSVKIYDRTGTVLLYDLHDNIQRTLVPLSAISPNVQHATIAIEDAEFYTHKGIRPLSTVRAVLTNILSGRPLSGGGGSTITQQVIKGSVLTGDKTVTRKFKEWVLALKLEQTMSKDQILEIYLNQAPYGGAMYGVEQASETFFNKHASDLSVAEAAYLAAVLPAPTYYSPYGNHKDRLDARKDLVLSKMLEHSYLTQEQYEAAKVALVEFQPQRDSAIQAPHFVFYVRQYLEEKYGATSLEESGWRVTTSLDADMQAKAEEIVNRNALSNTEKFNASNAGMIALDPKTGQILVMVGSRDYFDQAIDGNYNVTLASRQPGSAFKPFAYAESFIKGYTPSTVLFDVRTQFQTTCAADNYTSDGECYSPVNYDGNFRGPMTLRDALAQSINVPAVKILYLAGIADTLRLAKAMGISTLGTQHQYGLTLVLGGGEVTLLDMASAYGVFANNGLRMNPVSVIKIEDARGNIIEDNHEQQGSQVLPAFAAQEISDILSDPVARAPLGENTLFNFGGQDVAVKTGTTNDYRDAWTVGYSPNVVVGVWAGNNDNSSMVKRVSGFIVGPMWSEFMRYALTKVPAESFARTETSTAGLKPVLRGVWQGNQNYIQNNIEYVTQSVHEILHWVDKDNPTGPTPSNPASDPQYNLWEVPVRAWAAQQGYVDGAMVPVGAAPGSQTFSTSTPTF
ncbi:MAG: transglycosylase domain-containing protein [Patescibacteria group bacterium]